MTPWEFLSSLCPRCSRKEDQSENHSSQTNPWKFMSKDRP